MPDGFSESQAGGVEDWSGEHEKPFGVELVNLVHERNGSVFVELCGVVGLAYHDSDCVVPLVGTCGVSVVVGVGEIGEQSRESFNLH